MSDYYILIVGRYCGTLINEEWISYTEKEYNYALSNGIPILSFIISDEAKKESYGIETNKQQKALKKFIKRVKMLPCGFWNSPDELAYKVSLTLSIKFRENNRNGWIPYNAYGINNTSRIEKYYCGEYDMLYYFFRTIIISKLIINLDGTVKLYNGVKNNISDAEYTYLGTCEIQEGVIYIY